MRNSPVVPRASGARVAEWPVSLFGAVMGLSGLALAWRLATRNFGAPGWIGDVFAALAWLAFVALVTIQIRRAVRDPSVWMAELRHPITGSFLGTFWISLLLLPMLLPAPMGMAARVMWMVGAVGMTAFAWFSIQRWIGARQEAAHATPTWIIPVVGLLDIPLAYPTLGLPSLQEPMLFALAVGLFFAVPLFAMIFSRLMFHEPLPPALQPTLLILVAPFAVGFSAYVAVMGQVDVFARGLFYLNLFVLAVLLGRLQGTARGEAFQLSWWAVSFPVAASAVAALKFSVAMPSSLSQVLALGMLAFATSVIVVLLLRTLMGIARGETLLAGAVAKA
ncbi:SLAC1 anion channel family protein [Dyella subtropica]|uniref:SLAC1 anion channel family protein n=1 Tax=Dyella subtropica TaxID=2992127 RepID=UPI00225734B7|nr:SLAC1 anion channel family protein [Dyella subtropica]